MNISDLNYLEVVNTETGNALAGGGNINFSINKVVTLDKTVTLNITKNVTTVVDIDDLLATAEADAEAFGKYALAETDAFTYVNENPAEGEGEAFSYAESTAAIDRDQNGIVG